MPPPGHRFGCFYVMAVAKRQCRERGADANIVRTGGLRWHASKNTPFEIAQVIRNKSKRPVLEDPNYLSEGQVCRLNGCAYERGRVLQVLAVLESTFDMPLSSFLDRQSRNASLRLGVISWNFGVLSPRKRPKRGKSMFNEGCGRSVYVFMN